MPAINPDRLKMQTAELIELYSRPGKFIHRLHNLLNYYADRARRFGQSGESPPSLPTYHVPQPVLRFLIEEMKPLLSASPSRGLLLVDALWKEDWLEIKILAGSFLGLIPTINPGPILKRIKAYVLSCDEKQIQQTLADQGLGTIREDSPSLIIALIADLIETRSPRERKISLMIMHPLIRENKFSHLPSLFQQLDKLLEEEQGLRGDLVPVLKTIIQTSEKEAVYFLEDQLSRAAQPQITRIIRQCLPAFTPKNRERFQALIRQGP